MNVPAKDVTTKDQHSPVVASLSMDSPTADIPPACPGGQVRRYLWRTSEKTASVAYETLGTGPTVLLLPAFSTVSTRGELAQIAQMLAAQSLAEMQVLSELSGVNSDRLPGSLGLYEESGDRVGEIALAVFSA